VGHDVGVFHTGDGARPVHQVRVGAALVDLDAARFETWTAAHSTDDLPRDESVDALVRDGLLVGLEAVPSHRLLPLAQGLGNSAEQPWMFSVGLLYQPLVLMTAPMFDLWQWAHLSADLRTACEDSAAAAEEAGATDPEQIDPERVLAGALGVLPQLLAGRVACLDQRIGGPA
jgi:hypothetical protein